MGHHASVKTGSSRNLTRHTQWGRWREPTFIIANLRHSSYQTALQFALKQKCHGGVADSSHVPAPNQSKGGMHD
jgi:hypothetical protein